MEISKYRSVEVIRVNTCNVCSSPLVEAVIDLPKYPITEVMIDEAPRETLGMVDQHFHFCEKCKHGQLGHLISPEVLYGSTDVYTTRTAMSPSAMYAIEVFLGFCHHFLDGAKKENILEVGCNDLFTLNQVESRYGDVKSMIGVDPIFIGKETPKSSNKIRVVGDYVENVDFEGLGVNPDVIMSSHTFEHIVDPAAQIGRLLSQAREDTLFLFQVPSLELLVKHCQFDQLHHQHLQYFSKASFQHMLEGLGASLVGFDYNPFHWGALMVAFQKKRAPLRHKPAQEPFMLTKNTIEKAYAVFKDNMSLLSRRLDLLKDEKVYGFGAAAMLPILNYYVNLEQLECIVDDDPTKTGKYYLNFSKQIKGSAQISNFSESNVLVTAPFSKMPYRNIIARLVQMRVKNILLPNNMI